MVTNDFTLDSGLPDGLALNRRYETAERYYLVRCHRDLFGQVLVSRYWGSKNSRRGGERHDPVASLTLALHRMDGLSRIRLKRGYRVVNS